MAATSATYLRDLARRSIADAGIDEPPIDLTQLAASLCIPIRYVNLPSFFRGAVVNEDGMPVIVLNVAHPPNRQRQTLGHMLGHVLIVLDGGGYPRDSASMHAEADVMSVELFLPTHMVTEQARLWFNDYRYLSRMFGVDEGEMVERMRDLRILKTQHGISWEY